MKHVIYCNVASSLSRLAFILLLTFSTTILAQEGDPAKGKSLFNAQCASCHKLNKKMTGPALANVEQRLYE